MDHPTFLAPFNASTRTFMGHLPIEVGTIAVKVTASDGSTTVSDTFNITVTNTNDAPTVANAIADKSTAEDASFSYQVPSNTFADVDSGDNLTYTATLSNGSSLPAWIIFDKDTRSFFGTPKNSDVGTIAVKVTASDGTTTVSDAFNITVTNVNDTSTVATITDKTTAEDASLSYQIPSNAFADVDRRWPHVYRNFIQWIIPAFLALLNFNTDLHRYTNKLRGWNHCCQGHRYRWIQCFRLGYL